MITTDYYDFYVKGNDIRESCCKKMLDIYHSIRYNDSFKDELIRQFANECIDDGLFDNIDQICRGAMTIHYRKTGTMPGIYKAFKN